MTDNTNDLGVIQALLDRFNQQRLPQLLSMEERVNRGELLNDLDIAHLEEMSYAANQISQMIERHPEYKPLVAQVFGLYKTITSKALENQRKS